MSPRNRRKAQPDTPRQAFDAALLGALARDLKSGRTPLDKLTVSDDEVPGLRAIVRKSGEISLHVSYTIGESRPYLLLGHLPDLTIADARDLARTVLALAEKGIDPSLGLHARLIRELRAKGTRWRP